MVRDMRAITAKYIFNGVNLLTNQAVLIADGLIVDIVDLDSVFDINSVENFGNSVISAGFIDLQLNGCGGVLFNDDISLQTLEIMYQTNLKSGCTAYLPTLITSSLDDVTKALEVTKEWFNKFTNTRGVLGLHLEGPFLSLVKKGIHPEEFIINPTDEILAQVVKYVKYFPIKMTLAPEKFTAEQIKFLVKHGVIVSIGHSNATFAEAQLAIDSGATTATHLFNAMSGLTGRNPGVIGAVLSNNCYAGLIVDLLHVDANNVKLISKIKPTTAYLVTDAVTPTATDMTEFDFAGKHLYVKDGKCIDENGTLGGAFITMSESVRNCVNECGLSLEQALSMATLIPAQVIGVSDELGKIAKGYRADLIAMDLVDYSTQII